MSFKKNHPDNDNNDPDQEHKNGNTVNAVHVTHPFAVGRIGVSFFDIKVFGYLAHYSHKINFSSKIATDELFQSLKLWKSYL